MSPKRDLSQLRIDRGSSRGGSSAGWIAFFLLLIVSAVLIGWLQFGGRLGTGWEVELGRVVRLGGGPAPTGVAANGYVVARRRAALSTDIQGRLVDLRVEEGDRVKEGDLIARLDTRQLEASLAQVRADLAQAQAAVQLAKTTRDRVQRLASRVDTSYPAASQEELDIAQAELDQAEARVEQREAAIREIEVMIDKSSVYAPFAGVVVEKNAEVGEVVAATGATGANARGAVVTLVDFDTLEVQVELAQTSLRAARVGAPVLVYLDAYPEDGYPGRVRQIWPTADRQKATVELRVDFLRRDDRILPEMGVRVVFTPEEINPEEAPRILLPKRALVHGPRPSVFLYRDGAVQTRPVRLSGMEENGNLVVAEGLVGREQVVLDPPPELQDGDRVTPREESER